MLSRRLTPPNPIKRYVRIHIEQPADDFAAPKPDLMQRIGDVYKEIEWWDIPSSWTACGPYLVFEWSGFVKEERDAYRAAQQKEAIVAGIPSTRLPKDDDDQ